MCLSFAARVVAVDELGATIEADGRTRRALTTLQPETQVGDWVLVAIGAVVERLSPEAGEALQAMKAGTTEG